MIDPQISNQLMQLRAAAQTSDQAIMKKLQENAAIMNGNFEQFSGALAKIIKTLGPLVEALHEAGVVTEEDVPKLQLEIKRTVSRGKPGNKIITGES